MWKRSRNHREGHPIHVGGWLANCGEPTVEVLRGGFALVQAPLDLRIRREVHAIARVYRWSAREMQGLKRDGDDPPNRVHSGGQNAAEVAHIFSGPDGEHPFSVDALPRRPGAQLASAQTASKVTAVLIRSSSSSEGPLWVLLGWKNDIHVRAIERDTVHESQPERAEHSIPRIRPLGREERSHEDTA